MFATVSRARSYRRNGPQKQEEELPEPGADSTYGVRSFGDSDFGSGILAAREEIKTDVEVEEGLDEDMEEPGIEEGVDQECTPTPTTEQLITDELLQEIEGEAQGSPSPIIRSPNSPIYNLTEHQLEGYYRHTVSTPDDMSEPSSPASFASMPSYISSSLSRTSSLGPDPGGHRAGGYQFGYNGMGSEELVIPTLNVNIGGIASGSRAGSGFDSQSRSGIKHLGEKEEVERGIKVVILGTEGVVDDFMDVLRKGKATANLQGGKWGIFNDDLDMTTIYTGLSANELESKIEDAYTTLSGALHPDPSPELRDQVQELVAGYGIKSDWVHLVIALAQDPSVVASLIDIVPVITTPEQSQDRSSPVLSAHAIPDPTPRPGVEGLSYFATREPSLGEARSPVYYDLISQLVDTLHNAEKFQSASTSKFLTWRQARRDLASSHTSHSHESSSASYEGPPMPTLARAQGGGEWEANLSRRLAQRRQTHSQQSPSDQSTTPKRGRRRGSTTTSRPLKSKGSGKGKERETCGPLFPFSNTDAQGESSSGKGIAGVGVGLGELVVKTFGGLRRRWKWGLMAAAAVALVVGWNWNWELGIVRLSTCI